MARTKLKKLLKVKELPNVYNFEDITINSQVRNCFKAGRLYTLEIGCGHGDYSVELAKKFPNRNFIGVDVKGARIFSGAIKAIDEKLNNAAFIIGKAENLKQVFQPKSIEEIYIPFPEPHIRRTSENRRLISPFFLKIYKELLVDSGLIHFKTDDKDLYDYVLRSISDFGGRIILSTENLYDDNDVEFTFNIISNYEKYYIKQCRKIRYICFKF